MRKKHSFILTILPAENDTSPVHGRLEVIATGQIEKFSSLDELLVLLEQELKTLAEGMTSQALSGSKSQI